MALSLSQHEPRHECERSTCYAASQHHAADVVQEHYHDLGMMVQRADLVLALCQLAGHGPCL